jgi:hypothetical protein
MDPFPVSVGFDWRGNYLLTSQMVVVGRKGVSVKRERSAPSAVDRVLDKE